MRVSFSVSFWVGRCFAGDFLARLLLCCWLVDDEKERAAAHGPALALGNKTEQYQYGRSQHFYFAVYDRGKPAYSTNLPEILPAVTPRLPNRRRSSTAELMPSFWREIRIAFFLVSNSEYAGFTEMPLLLC